jgi:diaminopropionate ammonia-lyase
MARWFVDPGKRAWRTSPVAPDAYDFHRALPGYAPTPLVEAPMLAEELGVGRVFVKDESFRLGLPAFKVLGVSWAVNRKLAELAGTAPAPTLEALREIARSLAPLTLVTATDGNHGRALARVTAQLRLNARIVVPSGLPRAVVAAIESEGATVEEVPGSYDDAVRHAASIPGVLVQDMAWQGYESVPGWIVEGYSTLAREIDKHLSIPPDLVVVPTGVGSLLQAVVTHCRSGHAAPSVLAVEPVTAACVLESVTEGEMRTVETPGTVMAGLNCGTPSSIAWPVIRDGLDASIAVSDEEAMRAVDDLGKLVISAGPCGAAALAGVRAVLGDEERREAIGILPDAVVVLINTEGLASGSAG